MSFLVVSYAVLNAALAMLVLGVRPPRTANRIAALLFAENATHLLFTLSPLAGLESNFALAILSHAPLLALPLVFPVRRLSSRGAWTLVGVATILLLALGASFMAFGSEDLSTPQRQLYALVYLGTPAFGAALLTHDLLRARSDVQARQASLLLAPYLLKLAALVGGVFSFASAPTGDFAGAMSLVARAVLVGIVVAFAVSRMRGTTRPAAMDVLVLATVPAGFALTAILHDQTLEFLLVRPLLFTYAILRFQLLDVDVRERAGLIAIALLAAAMAVYLQTIASLALFGVDLATGIGIALVASLAAAGATSWPVLRAILERPGAPEPRARDIYVAALGEGFDDTSGSETSGARVLAALRQRLGISEREHAVLEASFLASRGRGEDLREGARFLGRYQIVRLLGEGGFGRTWLARDEQVGRDVALKVARATSRAEGQRLAREARLIARAGHPSIVTVYDVEVVGEEVIIVLEYVPGGSLADRLAAGALPLPEALRIGDDLLGALEAAHAEGMVHRDVKPANVLLTKEGRAKLADFGVARTSAAGDTASGLSLEGRHPGSLRYMSPEQVRGEPIDARSDLYSAAVVLYEAIAGRAYLDLRGRTDFDVRVAILEEEPLPLAEAPAPLARAIARALAKDPATRPASARAFRVEIAQSISPSAE